MRLEVRKKTNDEPKVATIDRADFERLMADGWSANWYLNSAGEYRYVNVADPKHKGDNTPVARLIANTPRGRTTQYRDGDRLNLRRSNLAMTKGFAKGKTPVETDADDEAPNSAQKSEGAYHE